MIVPTPEELKLRGEKRFKEMGKEVPAEAVNEMLGTTEIGFAYAFVAFLIITCLNIISPFLL